MLARILGPQAWLRKRDTAVVSRTPDWTDRLLGSLTALDPRLDVAPYEVTARIARIALHISRRQEQVFGRFGLNRGDMGVLSALRIAGSAGLSPTHLFKGLMLSSAGITGRLDRLEERGLARRSRHPNDRRGILVELTEEGRRVLDEAVRANTSAERELVAGLAPEELSTLAGLLKVMLAGLESDSA